MFGVVGRVKTMKKRTQSLVQLNLELAKFEGKQKATAVGIAGGSRGCRRPRGLRDRLCLCRDRGGAQRGPLALALAAHRGGILLLVAAVVGFLAMRIVRKASPPMPTQAIEEAGRTVEALQSHV